MRSIERASLNERCAARRAGRSRRGTVLVLAALLMAFLLGMIAFGVDLGYIANTETELKRTADAAALAGAGMLIDGAEGVTPVVNEFIALNPVAGRAVDPGDTTIEFGHWDDVARSFLPSNEIPSAIRVTLQRNDQPLFFGRIFGRDQFSLERQAVAMYQPRDIMLVLDYSGSMNDDSELKSIDVLGRDAVEANIQEIWSELGHSTIGGMDFAPEYATVLGDPPSDSSKPQISVTFKPDELNISSTKPLSQVTLRFKNGLTQTFGGLSGYSGTFKGTGYYNNQEIRGAYVRSGTNGGYSGYGEYIEDTTSNVIEALGLNGVSYPYNGGGWSNYISYVKTSAFVRNAGYQKMYGGLTLTNYWLEKQAEYSQTEDLWQTSEQPITAVKEAVKVFLAFLQEVDTDDKLGLSVYTSSNSTAKLEHQLTRDFDTVETISRQRQAGHYDAMTNIAAGMKSAREEIEDNARLGAFKMMILMTDGQANLPGNSSQSKQAALDEAYLAAAKNIPIVTISLGSGADIDLMDEIASITNGVHFNIPGGQPVEAYEEDLKEVFRKIADDRPLKLVK